MVPTKTLGEYELWHLAVSCVYEAVNESSDWKNVETIADLACKKAEALRSSVPELDIVKHAGGIIDALAYLEKIGGHIYRRPAPGYESFEFERYAMANYCPREKSPGEKAWIQTRAEEILIKIPE